MAKKTSQKQKAGKCVFCGGRPLSKEHVWSDWLSKFIPQGERHFSEQYGFRWDGSRIAAHRTPLTEFQGSLIQRKVRRVCVKCNTGWMKRAVDRARPFAEKLLDEEGYAGRMSETRNLVTWIAIACATGDLLPPAQSVIPRSELRSLMENELPPPGWTIVIGRYKGTEWRPWRRMHFPAVYLIGSRRIYTQLTTYTLGNFVAQIFSSNEPKIVEAYRKFGVHSEMAQIFPECEACPITVVTYMNDTELTNAAIDFHHAVSLGIVKGASEAVFVLPKGPPQNG